MKTTAILGLTMALGSVGCASGNMEASSAERGWSGAAWHDSSAIRVGEAHVMATRVNPLAHIGLASQGGAIEVTYERPGRSRAVAHVDTESLQPVAPPEGVTARQADGANRGSAAPDATPARVVLEGGGSVVVWKRGDAEWGYRLFAQQLAADGAAVGAPVAISPPNVDVMGAPQAVTTDGRHVVATFAAAGDRGIELMAVPIDVPPASALERIARK